MGRIGVEARWLTSGPPSGRRFLRGIIGELAFWPDLPGGSAVIFTEGRCEAATRTHGGGLVYRRLPSVPAPIFNSLEIQLALPRDVHAVLYQSFTPPRSRAARVTLIHDLIYLTRPEFFTRLELAYFRLFPRFLRYAEVVAAVSDHVRSELLQLFPSRDPASVVVVPNGVDPDFYLDAPARAEAASACRRHFDLDRPYVVVVGRINPRKNLPRLIRAFRRISPEGVELVVAGSRDGAGDPEFTGELKRSDRSVVRVLGYVPDPLLPGLYAGAELACYVSLDEGFGVPPLEAMATGTPVLASAIPAVREVVEDAALLVDPASEDAIAHGLRRLVRDHTLRHNLILRGRSRAGRFRWSASTRAMLDALELARQVRAGG